MQVTGYLVHYKSVILFLFLFQIKLSAQQYHDPKVDNLVKSGIRKILEQDYHDAERVFRNLETNYSELPLGSIYLAAVKISKAIDYGIEFENDYIEEKLEKAEELSEKLLKLDQDNIWNHYFIALANGYKAYYYALDDQFLNAFKYGLDSYSEFEKCYLLDSTFYEAYIAIGSYKYWKSEKTKSLSWLPFIEDEREDGIKFLKESLKHYSYNQFLAVYSLIWIYINKGRSDEAIKLAEIILKKYPESRFFKWTIARAYTDVDKRKAISYYKDILESVSGLSKNHYNEIILKHKIAMLYHDLREDRKALQLCDEILEIENLPEEVADKLDERIDRVKKLKSELLEH